LFFAVRTGIDAAETPAMAIFSEPVGMFRLTLTGAAKSALAYVVRQGTQQVT
jgi:hypothetical protein